VPQRDKRSLRSAQLTEKRLDTSALAVDSDVLCCDYRYLNKFTWGDTYPTPGISDVIHRVGKAHYISSWDLKSGYHQLLIKPEHRWLTAFVTDFGVFEWIRMPFGPKVCIEQFALELFNKSCSPFTNLMTNMLMIWLLFLIIDHCI